MKPDEKTPLLTMTRPSLHFFLIKLKNLFFHHRAHGLVKPDARKPLTPPKVLCCRSYSYYLIRQSVWLNYRKLLIHHSERAISSRLSCLSCHPNAPGDLLKGTTGEDKATSSQGGGRTHCIKRLSGICSSWASTDGTTDQSQKPRELFTPRQPGLHHHFFHTLSS